MQSRRREYNVLPERLREKYEIDLTIATLKDKLQFKCWIESGRDFFHPLYPGEATYAIKLWPTLFVHRSKNYIGITTKDLEVVLCKLTFLGCKENVLQIDRISTQEWSDIFGESCEMMDGPLREQNFGNQFPSKFASVYGIPHTLCFIERVLGTYIISVTNPVLLKLYQDVVYAHPYDVETFVDICDRIVDANNESAASLHYKYIKSDYELVTLQNYTEFSHVRDGDTLDFGRPLPRYWFDPLDCEFDITEHSLRDYFALSDFTHPKLTHIIVCGFPAGALFLRCRAESQRSGGGGGIEYLYLRNVSQRVQVVRTIELI